MIQKGNYLAPEVQIIDFDLNDMIRTSIELEDGVAMQFNQGWVDG